MYFDILQRMELACEYLRTVSNLYVGQSKCFPNVCDRGGNLFNDRMSGRSYDVFEDGLWIEAKCGICDRHCHYGRIALRTGHEQFQFMAHCIVDCFAKCWIDICRRSNVQSMDTGIVSDGIPFGSARFDQRSLQTSLCWVCDNHTDSCVAATHSNDDVRFCRFDFCGRHIRIHTNSVAEKA